MNKTEVYFTQVVLNLNLLQIMYYQTVQILK